MQNASANQITLVNYGMPFDVKRKCQNLKIICDQTWDVGKWTELLLLRPNAECKSHHFSELSNAFWRKKKDVRINWSLILYSYSELCGNDFLIGLLCLIGLLWGQNCYNGNCHSEYKPLPFRVAPSTSQRATRILAIVLLHSTDCQEIITTWENAISFLFFIMSFYCRTVKWSCVPIFHPLGVI